MYARRDQIEGRPEKAKQLKTTVNNSKTTLQSQRKRLDDHHVGGAVRAARHGEDNQPQAHDGQEYAQLLKGFAQELPPPVDVDNAVETEKARSCL